MASRTYDVAVIGGGIIGLASALQVTQRFPGTRVVVLEKEEGLARHQTGHNSGVIHSGIYYRPGSWKAQFCVDSVEKLKGYCREKGIEFDECGKVIVATEEAEIPRLERGLSLLITIAQITPLLGLLGTVLGMMNTLLIMHQQAPLVHSGDLTGGLWLALTSTAAGLIVAIPAYAGHNFLVSRVEEILLDMERSSSEILDYLTRRGELTDEG